MKKIVKLLTQYSSHIKYSLIVIVILAMIMSIRTYLNFVSIEDAIVRVETDSDKTQEEIFYVERFLIPYLSSSYAEYFNSHENNALLRGELIVRFEEMAEEKVVVEMTGSNFDDHVELDAKESWQLFWEEKMQKFR